MTGALGNGEVRLEVSDDGPGVLAERVADLFVPFARWGGASDSTGLGLAISRGNVEAHGGSLEYRSAENGVGHAFVVTLPPGDHESSAARPGEKTVEVSRGAAAV